MIDSLAIQEQVSEVMDDVLPSVPNASLITRTGGTENAYGEPEGEIESLTPIYLKPEGEYRNSRNTSAGDTGPIQIRFLAKSDVAINEGDRIRFDGNDYLVEFVEKETVGDHQVYWEGRISRIHGN